MVNHILATCFALACFCAPSGAGEDRPPQPGDGRPFFRLREHQTNYAGPGREQPPPKGVDQILIGYFGPSDPSHPQAGDLWLAAQLAVEEANREGGYHGKPFRILPCWSESPWGTGVRQVARMVYGRKVWAIVGGIDAASTHLAEQVVAKARLALVSPASSDKTVNLANVPWMFSLLPGDHLQASVLAAAISARIGPEPFVFVSAVDHDSALFAEELRKRLAARHMVPRFHFKCSGAPEDETRTVTRVVQSDPSAVVLAAGAHQSARLVAGLREQGFQGLVFGGPAMGRRRFLEQAGEAAEGVVFPLLFDPQAAAEDDVSSEFLKGFQSNFGRLPDYAAAHTYDAFRLLVAAIRTAGLNRARIRDALSKLSPYSGVTGIVAWDPLGSNTRAVSLGTIRDGRVVPAAETSEPSPASSPSCRSAEQRS